MNGRVFDVVAYIAQRYGRAETALDNPADLRDELADAGYREDEVERAIGWLQRLRRSVQATAWTAPEPRGAVRVPSPEEADKLTAAARGYLQRLESAGLLDLTLRETVYERAMALDMREVGEDELRVLVALLLTASGRGLDELAAGVLADDLEDRYH